MNVTTFPTKDLSKIAIAGIPGIKRIRMAGKLMKGLKGMPATGDTIKKMETSRKSLLGLNKELTGMNLDDLGFIGKRVHKRRTKQVSKLMKGTELSKRPSKALVSWTPIAIENELRRQMTPAGRRYFTKKQLPLAVGGGGLLFGGGIMTGAGNARAREQYNKYY